MKCKSPKRKRVQSVWTPFAGSILRSLKKINKYKGAINIAPFFSIYALSKVRNIHSLSLTHSHTHTHKRRRNKRQKSPLLLMKANVEFFFRGHQMHLLTEPRNEADFPRCRMRWTNPHIISFATQSLQSVP